MIFGYLAICLQEVGIMILFRKSRSFRACIWQPLCKSMHDKSYAKTRVHRSFILLMWWIFFLIEIDLLFYTKILHHVNVLWSSTRFIKDELQWTSKYFQATNWGRLRNMVRNIILDYLSYTGCCYYMYKCTNVTF